ncbi:hypothetical protein BRARA_G02067 [Brassica rapa]|uniref:Uncharacterized protein n=1 Tax=Brassica campestris TaxID=3711 RepID=A0A397YN02_BRACM|nr:hypothetical protein BRARA_G02067 [Brassica rapa]
MGVNGLVSSPLRRPHALKKQWEDLGSCSTLWSLLAFRFTIYIYFAVTLGSSHLSFTGMMGKEKAMCQTEHVKASFSKGKLKFF